MRRRQPETSLFAAGEKNALLTPGAELAMKIKLPRYAAPL